MKFIIILLLIMCLLILIIEKASPRSRSNTAVVINKKKYQRKNILTEAEKVFMGKLIKIENEIPVKIIPQINLAVIVEPTTKTKYISELFRNIDFAIVDNNYEKVLLLIELNDKSHLYKKRRERDKKVKEICDSANIKLMNFYTEYKNEESYIISRIKEELKNIIL